jgi:hypothetical protein
METPPRTVAGLLLSPLIVFILFPIVALLGLPLEVIFIAVLGPLVMIGIFLWRKSRSLPQTARFLLAYLIYNDGVQTVIAVSAIFAAAPVERGGLGIPVERLTLLILMIQFVAFAGALFFGWLAGRVSTKRRAGDQPADLERGGDLRLPRHARLRAVGAGHSPGRAGVLDPWHLHRHSAGRQPGPEPQHVRPDDPAGEGSRVLLDI